MHRILEEEARQMRLMKVEEAAGYLRVAASTLRSWIRGRRIRAVRYGRNLRLDRRDLDEFIERCKS